MKRDKSPKILPIGKLSDARKAAKLSKQQAAKAIGCHPDKITRLETGQTLTNLEDLATAYNCKIIIVDVSIYAKISQIWAILG